MGDMELESRKRAKKANLKRLILETIQVAGVLSVALLAPNAIGAMKKLSLLPSRRQKESINAAQNRLIQHKYIARDSQGMLRVTQKGVAVLEKIRAFEAGLPKPNQWDGKWRILIFDISQERGNLREKLRNSLRAVGFILLQRSVWVYPYDCEDFIALLKADFKIGKDMRYIIADTIEGDTGLRKHFSLRGF